MNVHPAALRKEVVATVKDVEAIIESVEREADEMDIKPSSLRDHRGNWVMAPLLLAKTQCLMTLAILNEQS